MLRPAAVQRFAVSEVETGAAFGQTLSGDRMDVTFTQDDVIVAPHFDLVAVLRVEQDLITRLHGPHVRAHSDDLGPYEALANLSSRGNENASSGPALTLRAAHVHQHTVIEHLDRKVLAGTAHSLAQHLHSLRCRHVPTVPSPPVTDDSDTLTLRLITADGLSLEAEARLPQVQTTGDDAENLVTGAVVLAHPHPQQGGSMTSLVTSELFRILPQHGLGVLRFNFRGVGTSEGSYGEGRAERADIVAAIDALVELWPTRPLVLCGWSFGGDTSLSVVDERLSAWVALAPPLRILPLEELSAAAGSDQRPTLLIVPEHDQFRTPGAAAEATQDWVNTSIIAIAGADHFLVGRTEKVAGLVTAFIRDLDS